MRGAGNATSVTTEALNASEGPTYDLAESHTYDSFGNLLSTTSAVGALTTYKFDGPFSLHETEMLGPQPSGGVQPTTQWETDLSNGEVTRSSLLSGAAGASEITEALYDTT